MRVLQGTNNCDAITLHIHCAYPVVPAAVEPGSTDRRAPAFLLEPVALEHST